MKKLNVLKISLFLMLIFISGRSQSQAYCEIVAEISLDVVERGAFFACTRSANPAACTIAIAAHNCGQDPACSGVVKTLTEKGCNYTVKVVGNKLRIYGKAAKNNVRELRNTYNALNSVEGITWIMNSMTGQ